VEELYVSHLVHFGTKAVTPSYLLKMMVAIFKGQISRSLVVLSLGVI
jgi:hypothetical protein